MSVRDFDWRRASFSRPRTLFRGSFPRNQYVREPKYPIVKALSMLTPNLSSSDALSSGHQVSGNPASDSSVSHPSFIVGPSAAQPEAFRDRRSTEVVKPGASERRQFGNSHAGLSDDGRDLALAIDRYKVNHHRRYLTCDEMIQVIQSLGYSKS